ncbi:MAG: aldehyde dehydrogenase family protein [Planctomycetes bacterium]|nr:aldehyde dehydrogenase family protein [Planctomycetota bacterium]
MPRRRTDLADDLASSQHAGMGSGLAEAVADLRRGAESWAITPFARRSEVLHELLRTVAANARAWVDAGCAIEGHPAGDVPDAVRAEEIATGPLAILRLLRLLAATHRHLAAGCLPPLPGPRTARGIPVFPTAALLDRWLFPGLTAHVEVDPDGPLQAPPAHGADSGRVALVLGAGNLTSIPVGDTLHAVFVRGQAVLLKLHALHRELHEVLQSAFDPLLRRDLCRIVCGDATLGRDAARHEGIDTVHLTGSRATWQTLADDPAIGGKLGTAELGGVTPVLVLPGRMDRRTMRYQAAHVATMVTNNASCNCIAAQVLITWQGWPQRGEFLDALEKALAGIPERPAWHPGVAERFARYFPERGRPHRLPWPVRRGLDRTRDATFFADEMFAPGLGEIALPARNADEFGRAAAQFANDEVAGQLGIDLIAPAGTDPEPALAELRYGVIGVNVWTGVGYGLMSPPWGGYPGGTSGSGSVHNTYLLAAPRKTVLRAPPRTWPTPAWFATHGRSAATLAALCRFYGDGGLRRIPRVVWEGVRGSGFR